MEKGRSKTTVHIRGFENCKGGDFAPPKNLQIREEEKRREESRDAQTVTNMMREASERKEESICSKSLHLANWLIMKIKNKKW